MPDSSTRSTVLRRLGVDLRPGEGSLCALLFSMHFLILAFQYVAKTVRQSTYVDALGAERLPFVYLLIPIVSYPLLLLYGRAGGRFEPHRLIAGSAVVVASSLVLFWWLFSLGAAWVSVVFYVWVAVVGVLLVSQFWSYSAMLLDPRQAKRLFGIIGAGGILGSIAGGQLASRASAAFDTRTALVLSAGLLFVLAAATLTLGHRPSVAEMPAAGGPVRGGRSSETLRDVHGGWRAVRGSPYLLRIAAVMLIGSAVAQVIDLQFSWAVEESTGSLDQRTATFGNVYSVMGVAAFIFQMLFTARIHRRLGVGFALRVLPVTNGLGTAGFVAAALAMPTLVLPAAIFLKISENGLRYSLDQATRELLFQPVPARERPQAKAFIDVFVQRLAKGGSALVLLTVTFGWFSTVQAAALSAVLIAVWLAVIGTTHRRYVAAYRDALLHQQLEVEEDLDLSDSRTLEVLLEGLASSDTREILHSLELLATHGRGRLVTPMLLYHPDCDVRCKTLQILEQEGRTDVAPMVERLLVDPDSTVRHVATVALVALTPQDIGRLMLDRLRDPDVRVRGVAVAYLVNQDDADIRERADTALAEMLTDGDPVVRREAARALGAMPEPQYHTRLIQLLYDSDPHVVRSAVRAVERRTEAGGSNPLYVPTLISLLHDRRLKHDARRALVVYGEGVIPALQHFLADHQEEIWVRRALPKTISHIGGRSALEALADSVGAGDLFLRRKVIEALGALRRHDPGLRFEPALVEDQLAAETRAYLRTLLDVVSLRGPRGLRFLGPAVRWPPLGRTPHLLERLLADRMDDHVMNLFRLLELVHTPRDIRAAHRGLSSDNATVRASALEFLDNLLAGEVCRWVFAVIDEQPLGERMREAKKLFDLEPVDKSSTLRRLAQAPPIGDADGAWITAAALHYIHDHHLESLYPVIEEAAEIDRTPLVQETTTLLLSRIAGA